VFTARYGLGRQIKQSALRLSKVNTASANFIPANHLMLRVIKHQSLISVAFRFIFMTWPLYTGALSTEQCVGVVARRKFLPLSEKQTEVVLSITGNYSDGDNSATNFIFRLIFYKRFG